VFQEIAVPGGRIDTRVERTLHVRVLTRLALDEPDRDSTWIKDKTLGHFVLEESVCDALQNFQPTDTDGNWLVDRPLHLANTDNAETDEDEPGWGHSIIQVNLAYILPLTQPPDPNFPL
jgi:hypothetical protein